MKLPPQDVWEIGDFARRAAALDFETHRIQAGLLAPPVVCGSLSSTNSPEPAHLLDAPTALATFRNALRERAIITGANIAFDFGVLLANDPTALDDIFAAYEEGRVFDVLLAQYLDAIAHGLMKDQAIIDPRTGGKIQNPTTRKQAKRFSLEIVVDQVLGRVDAKNNGFWRERYKLLEDIPLDLWPRDAAQYPKDDALNTLETGLAQVGAVPRKENPYDPPTTRPNRNLRAMTSQARAAWALHLACMQLLRVDLARVAPMRAAADEKHTKALATFTASGILNAAGKKSTAVLKRLTATAYGASGSCAACAGSGKVPSQAKSNQRKCKPCKAAGGFEGVVCLACDGRGWVLGGSKVNCKACDASGLDLDTAPALPRTPTLGISCSRDTLKESGDELLDEFGDVSENEKWRNTYLPFLEQGRVTLKSNTLLSSGRASYDGLIQLMPRGGGLRECFIPRPGYVFCSIDYSALELATLAQCCLWFIGDKLRARGLECVMAQKINEGADLHCLLASQMIGQPYDHVFKNKKIKPYVGYRQASKPGNFMLGGGGGELTFVMTQRKESGAFTVGPDGRVYKGNRFCLLLGMDEVCGRNKLTEWKRKPCAPVCSLCMEAAVQIKRAYLTTYPEMPLYFDYISDEVDYTGSIEIPYPDASAAESYMTVGGRSFTSGANGYFQGLAAAGAKHALWEVTKECYTMPDSPMYGARPVFFVHDEIFSEIPEELADRAARRMTEVMVQAMKLWVPDVKITAEPALMRRWYKAAEPVYRDGVLVPWEPPAPVEERRAA